MCLLDLLEKAIRSVENVGVAPYAILCNRENFEKLVKELQGEGPFGETAIPFQIRIKRKAGNLPVFQSNQAPPDGYIVVDKVAFESFMAAMWN